MLQTFYKLEQAVLTMLAGSQCIGEIKEILNKIEAGSRTQPNLVKEDNVLAAVRIGIQD